MEGEKDGTGRKTNNKLQVMMTSLTQGLGMCQGPLPRWLYCLSPGLWKAQGSKLQGERSTRSCHQASLASNMHKLPPSPAPRWPSPGSRPVNTAVQAAVRQEKRLEPWAGQVCGLSCAESWLPQHRQ